MAVSSLELITDLYVKSHICCATYGFSDQICTWCFIFFTKEGKKVEQLKTQTKLVINLI